MLAASDVTVDALFQQAGVIRTDSLAEMLDVASLLANQPLPEGRRVAVLTNAGGPGIMCADACEASGLELPPLPKEIQERLREFLPPEASLGNPVDMIATATGQQYRQAVAALAAWDGIDALIVIFVRPLLIKAEDVADGGEGGGPGHAEANPGAGGLHVDRGRRRDDPQGRRADLSLSRRRAPSALARVVGTQNGGDARPGAAELRRRARQMIAAAAIAEALEDGPGWLDFERRAGCWTPTGFRSPDGGWPMTRGRPPRGRELGGSVALKALGPEIVHKTDLGALRLGLPGGQQVSDAAAGIDEGLRAPA